MATSGGSSVNLLTLVRDLWGSSFRISRWYIPGHDGIDLPAKTGTPIRAVASGRVFYARDARLDPNAGKGWAIGGGNTVDIDVGGNLATQYAHLDRLYVKSGDYVTKGQVIGTVGSTGGTPNSPTASFGASNAHLHFGLWDRKANKMIEPTKFLLAARAGWNDSGGLRPPDSYDNNRISGFLTGWGNLVSFPVGHTITAADVDTIIAKLKAGGLLGTPSNPDPFGISEGIVRGILMQHVGQAWNKSLQDQLAAEFGAAAVNAGDLGGAKTGLDAIGGAIGTLSDPGLWVRILALIVGLAIAGYGTVGVLRSTANPVGAY